MQQCKSKLLLVHRSVESLASEVWRAGGVFGDSEGEEEPVRVVVQEIEGNVMYDNVDIIQEKFPIHSALLIVF